MKRTLENQSKRDIEQSCASSLVDFLNSKAGSSQSAPKNASDTLAQPVCPVERAMRLLICIAQFPRADFASWDYQLINELNVILAEHPTSYSVQADILGFPRAFQRPVADWQNAAETAAIFDVVSLGAEGLAKIQTCLCGRWYVRQKSDHKSCSVACRKRKREQTAEYKRNAAARAKANYHLRKTGYGT